MEQTPVSTQKSEDRAMSTEEYEKRMTDLDKEHDRRADLIDPADHDALDRLDSWHAKMTDMVDAEYCSPGRKRRRRRDVRRHRGRGVQRLER